MAAQQSAATPPIINDNPALQSYYNSLESRIGYRVVLGGTRHFGWYDAPPSQQQGLWARALSAWPFPVGAALRRMERKLLEALGELPPGAAVLDAGCGVGHVALFVAAQGALNVTAIDVTDRHLDRARRNVRRAERRGVVAAPPSEQGIVSASQGSGAGRGSVRVLKMDYHHLETLGAGSLDGAYTMETLVHATDCAAVLAQLHRVLRPGGRVALFEYDHVDVAAGAAAGADPALERDWDRINELAAMPTNARSERGFFEAALTQAGFEDVVVRDYSANIRPMLWLFAVLAAVPLLVVRVLGLEKHFVNTLAGAKMLGGQKYWRFVAISARKPPGGGGGEEEVGEAVDAGAEEDVRKRK